MTTDPLQGIQEKVPRYRGMHAPLAALAGRLNSAKQAGDERELASISGRLARQLARRSVEIREAIQLANKSLRLEPDATLATELAGLLVGIGDFVHAADALSVATESAPPEQRSRHLTRGGLINAHAGRIAPALDLLHEAQKQNPNDPLPFEILGALGFWSDVSARQASQALVRASELRAKENEETRAFEDLLSAFEIDPVDSEVTEALLGALRRRGRRGAAQEIQREHLRHGLASKRAAHYERTFFEAVRRSQFTEALDAALEAELDVELDPERLEQALATPNAAPDDFASFLVQMAFTGALGSAEPYRQWLLSLIDAHRHDWGNERVDQLQRRCIEALQMDESRVFEPLHDARAERVALAAEHDPSGQRRLRECIARAALSRGLYEEAVEVLEPLLEEERADVTVAALALLAAGRTRDAAARARSLGLLARSLPDEAAVVTFALASEGLSGQGLVEEALEAAARAVEANPKSERAVAAQALVALRHPHAASAPLLESSLSVLVARGEACLLLCRAAAERGSHRLAMTWAQRTLTLRPGDPEAAAELLRCATRAGDEERLHEEILRVLEQPLPYVEVAEDLADALNSLAELSLELAVKASHAVLRSMGARFESCREAVNHVAERSGDAELSASVLERRIALASTDERSRLLMDLADARARAGDAVSASRALRRALAQGVDPLEVSEKIEQLGQDLDPDATLSVLEARVTLAGKLSPEAHGERAELLRNLGAARWDMAEDREGALSAWLQAADLDPELGLERFAHILSKIAGIDRAAVELEKMALSSEDPERQGRLFGLAARAMLELGMAEEAFRLSRAALERAPHLADLLTLAEQAAGSDRLDDLETIYQHVADATLGAYGERAVHYRAARMFEQSGRLEQALTHAVHAFEAVPAEGVAFVLMLRLADRVENREPAVRAVERVARGASSDDDRVRWLDKAAGLADDTSVGFKQRVDVLLRAAQVRPEDSTITSLDAAIGDYLKAAPDAQEGLGDPFRRVATEAVTLAAGAHGAVICIGLCQIALSRFQDLALASACLQKAIECDIEVPEYGRLQDLTWLFADSQEHAHQLLVKTRESSEEAGRLLGRELALVMGGLAERLGEYGTRVELLVRAASDAPEDVELASLAGRGARDLGRSELLEIVEDLLPIAERGRALLERLDHMGPEQGLEALCSLDIDAAEGELKVQLLTELAKRQELLGQGEDAAATWRELREVKPDHMEALSGIERFAQRYSDHEELARVLEERESLQEIPEEAKLIRIRRAVVLDTKLGRPDESRALLEDLLESHQDWAVLRMLADSWERSEDQKKAAELWLRAREFAPDPKEASDAAFRAARALFSLGDLAGAQRALSSVEYFDYPSRELELAVARASDDTARELDALVGLAEEAPDATLAAANYLEAARVAEGLGRLDDAERYAKDASELPEAPAEARLLAAQFRVRSRPLATRRHAKELLEKLEGTEGVRNAAEREMRAFLLAEARAVLDGHRAAIAELEAALKEQGDRPLLCASLAEKVEDPERALALYEQAIGGELRGMRRPSDLLLHAAAVAKRQGQWDRARAFASAVADDDPRRPEAARELEAISVEQTKQRRLEREATARVEAERREREEAERKEREETERKEAERQAREEAERKEREQTEARRQQELEENRRAAREEAERERREAKATEERLEAGAGEVGRKSSAPPRPSTDPPPELAGALTAKGPRPRVPVRSERPEPPTAKLQSSTPPHTEKSRVAVSGQDAPPKIQQRPNIPIKSDAPPEQAQQKPSTTANQSSRPPASSKGEPGSGRLSTEPPLPLGELTEVEGLSPEEEKRALHVGGENEEDLVSALERGDVDAGLRLFETLSRQRSRTRDAAVIAGHLARLRLGNAAFLGRLVTAAARDGNEPLALAVRHVLGSYGAGAETPPPSLARLEEQPEAARAVLWNGVRIPELEVTGLVWEHAQSLFKKEPSDYGITGAERVPLTGHTELAQLYREAARVLGMTRTPLFRKPGQGDIQMHVGLLSPPAVIVEGEIDEISRELSFHLGAMLAATTPEHALVFGSSPEELDSLVQAIDLSFGAGRGPGAKRPPAEVGRLAARLWETIPPRIQRRLSSACAQAEDFSAESLWGAARWVLRRAGLLVCGSITTAIADACDEVGITPPKNLSQLEESAAQHPAIFDLLALAISPTYAEIRFREQYVSSSAIRADSPGP